MRVNDTFYCVTCKYILVEKVYQWSVCEYLIKEVRNIDLIKQL